MIKLAPCLALFGAIALAIFVARPALAGGTIDVGEPSNPGALSGEIANAYAEGYSTIVINPGVYNLPDQGATAFQYTGWSNVTISGAGVTLIATDIVNGSWMFVLTNCTNVNIEGTAQSNITLSQYEPVAYQGHVTAIGPVASNGDQTLDVFWETGYPVPPTTGVSWFDGVDGRSLAYKQGNTDYYNSTNTSVGNGIYQVDFGTKTIPMGIGDIIWGRYGNPVEKVYWVNCNNCTCANMTIEHNGFSPIFEWNSTGDHILNVTWAPGPPPSGATVNPVVASNSDGIDSYGAELGPDIENCTFGGIIGDDEIAIYSFAEPITAVSGAVLTVTNASTAKLAVGQPAIITASNFYVEGTVTGLVNTSGTNWSVTMDQNYHVPANASIDNPNYQGNGYKVIDCTLATSRQHGVEGCEAWNGTISGNHFNGLLAPSVWLGSSAQNIVVNNNTFVDTQGGSPAVSVASIGAQANSNIDITDNIFTDCDSNQIQITGTSGAEVTDNTFISPDVSPGTGTSEVQILNSSNVTIAGNISENRGSNVSPTMVSVDPSSTNVTGAEDGVVDLDSLVAFQSELDGLVIADPASGGAGTQLEQYTANGSSNQNWFLWATPSAPGNFTMVSGANGLYTDIASTSPGAAVALQALSGTYAAPASHQLWSLQPVDASHLNIVNDDSLDAISIQGSSQTVGADLIQSTASNSSNMDWTMIPEAYTGSPLFYTGLESGQTQPTWSDDIYSDTSNITGFYGNENPAPQCSIRSEGVAHTGTTALMYSGSAPATNALGTATFCYYKSFSTSIPIDATTKLSYWIYPQSEDNEDNSRFVGIDFLNSDGSDLRDSGAVDYNGFSMHPGAGHGAMLGYDIPLNTWTQIKCNIGQWLAGKTVNTILVGYDETGATGAYRGYIDDVTITDGPLPISPSPATQIVPNSGYLTAGQYVASPSGNCFLEQLTNGDLVLYSGSGPTNQGAVLWSSGYTATSGTFYTAMQGDGNLVTYEGTPTSPGNAEWSSVTYGNNYCYLQVTDAMQIQISDGQSIIWQSPSTMASSGFLSQGQYIVSPNRQYFLMQQNDGNLVLYTGSGPYDQGYAVWASGYSSERGNYFTELLPSGNLETFSGTEASPGPAIWSSNTSGTNCVLQVTNSGQVQVVSGSTVLASNPELTTITVSPATASVIFGNTQQFSATGHDQYGNVLGIQPTFTWTTSGGGTINAASGLLSATTPGGPFTVTASKGSINGTSSVTVTKAATTTSLTSSSNPSTYGSSITFTATVSPTVPNGETVTFYNGGTSIGTGTTSSGVATLAIATLPPGSLSITASYAGDANYATSTSSVLTQTVNKKSTTTTLTSSANPSTYNSSVTFTATVSPTVPNGETVTFYSGGTSIGTGTTSSSVATLAIATLPAGSLTITATYAGDTNYSASTSSGLIQTVNKKSTTTTLTSSVNPSVQGNSVQFTATISPVVPNGETVTFYNGGTSLGTGTTASGAAALTTSSLPEGTLSITATCAGDANYSASTSGPLSQSVQSYSIAVSPSSNTIDQGTTGFSTVSLTGINGFTGTVALTATGLPSGVTVAFTPSSISGSTTSYAIFTVSPTAATGTHTITINATDGSAVQTATVTLTVGAGTTLANNTYLVPGQSIESAGNTCYLTLTTTGQLILYSGTPTSQGAVIWSSTNPGTVQNYYSIIQTDGNFVTYIGPGPQNRGAAEWSSATYNAGAGCIVTVLNSNVVQILQGSTIVWQEPGTAQVSLSSYYNLTGIVTDGSTFTGGIDGYGTALSGTFLGASQTWNGETFTIGAVGANNVITATGQSIALPAGSSKYGHLYILADAVNGGQVNQTLSVSYSTGSPTTFTQSFSDWGNPASYSGESKAVTMTYRDLAAGGKQTNPYYIYGYTFALDNSRVATTLNLPSNNNLKIISLVLGP